MDQVTLLAPRILRQCLDFKKIGLQYETWITLPFWHPEFCDSAWILKNRASVWNLDQVTLLAPRILRQCLDFKK